MGSGRRTCDGNAGLLASWRRATLPAFVVKRSHTCAHFVSTIVPYLRLFKVSSADCERPAAKAYASGDAFIFDPASETAPVAIAP